MTNTRPPSACVRGRRCALSAVPELAGLSSRARGTTLLLTNHSVLTPTQMQRTYDATRATPLALDDILSGERLWCATKAAFSAAAILVVTPMLILCGVFYPIAGLQAAMQVLPVSHAVALARPLVAGLPVTDLALHVAVLVVYAIGGLYVGLALTRWRRLSGSFVDIREILDPDAYAGLYHAR